MVPILFRGICLRDNKEDNEKRRKQDEKRLEIQCMDIQTISVCLKSALMLLNLCS